MHHVTQTLDSDLRYTFLILDTALDQQHFSGFESSHAHTKGNNRLEELRVLFFFFEVTQDVVNHVEEMKQKEIHLLAGHSWKSFTHQNIGSINMYEWVEVVGVH